MKTILDIYKEYKIMPNLQMHMLRVAAAASLICDNFTEPLPKEDIVAACLLHDMGNIVKSNFEFLPTLVEPEGVDYWQGVKDEFIQKYGKDDHRATLLIVKEIKTKPDIFALLEKVVSTKREEYKDVREIAMIIYKYSDTRASPFGIMPLKNRLDEWKRRNPEVTEQYLKEMYVTFSDIEWQIFAKCKIKPEDITDESVAPVIAGLKNFVIK